MKTLLVVLLLLPVLAFGQKIFPDITRENGWVAVKSGKTDPSLKGFVNVKRVVTFKLDSESVRRAPILVIYSKPSQKIAGLPVVGISRDVLFDCKGETFNFLSTVIYTTETAHQLAGSLTSLSAEPDTLTYHQMRAICDLPEGETVIEDVRQLNRTEKRI